MQQRLCASLPWVLPLVSAGKSEGEVCWESWQVCLWLQVMAAASLLLSYPYSSFPVTRISHTIGLLLRNSLSSSWVVDILLFHPTLIAMVSSGAWQKHWEGVGEVSSRKVEGTAKLHVFGFCLAARAFDLLYLFFALRFLPRVLSSVLLCADPLDRNAPGQKRHTCHLTPFSQDRSELWPASWAAASALPSCFLPCLPQFTQL